MSRKKPQLEGITLVIDVCCELTKRIDSVASLIDDIIKSEKERIHQEFVFRGGCEKCHGRGWVVTWDTMDSMTGCYAEYGRCSNEACTEETRIKSGLDSTYSKYDRNRGLLDPTTSSTTYKVLTSELVKLYGKLYSMFFDASELGKVTRGKVVVAARGRKVPVGFVGEVAWQGVTKKGLGYDMCKIVSNDGEEKWCYTSNVEVVAPNSLIDEVYSYDIAC